MNLLVTGATGYLGSAVAAGLLADGHTVRAHVRSIASADRLPAGAGPVAGDLGDPAGLRARIDESGGVVHAATPNDATCGSFDAAFLDVALSALAGSDRPLVYTGGTWVHGSGDPITEESPINPPPMVTWRPAVLQRLRPVAADGIRTVIAPASVYGAGPCYLGANAHSPTMTELATAASRSRGLNGRIAPEPEADSRARLGLFLATFMLLLDITVVNTALPSIHGEES
jgi:NAD(P)-dependent dehydrogenase (short-subunit alcohol dehydrogenase family)